MPVTNKVSLVLDQMLAWNLASHVKGVLYHAHVRGIVPEDDHRWLCISDAKL